MINKGFLFLLAIVTVLALAACTNTSAVAVCHGGVASIKIKAQGMSAVVITCKDGKVYIWNQ